MKQRLDIWMGVMILAGLLIPAAAAQSLGDHARQQRDKKGPPPAGVKEYTNDNLPTSSGAISQVGAASTPAASAAASKAEEKTEADQSKLEATWRGKFKAQKDKIAVLERELALSSQEGKSRCVSLALEYNTRLAAEDQKAKDELNQKKKDLADAKQALEDMQDELRKAGLPNSWAD